MNIRTDIAAEFIEDFEDETGYIQIKKEDDGFLVETVQIIENNAAKKIGKPIGIYKTVTTGKIENCVNDEFFGNKIKNEIEEFIKDYKNFLVVGIGNNNSTPDSVGPKTASKIFATRHIEKELAKSVGLEDLNNVSVISPGVLGQTGIEVKEIIEGVIKASKPDVIILIDALAARSIDRLGTTIQISNIGISPGSGIGNKRSELTQKSLGIPCVSIGIPTVVDASTLLGEISAAKSAEIATNNMIVTPRDIDMIIENSADILSFALNSAMHPKINSKVIMSFI